MLAFDHITVVAPTLEEGIAHVRSALEIEELGNPARHRDMGTHNQRLRLGNDVYLEVVAADPAAPRPARLRWFGLDSPTLAADWAAGIRLKAWVCRTDGLDRVLAGHASVLGKRTRLDGRFDFALLPDGSLPLAGALPCVIDRGGAPPPSVRMADRGLRLEELVLEHPDPERIEALYADLGISDPPRVRQGDAVRLSAAIATPTGLRRLT